MAVQRRRVASHVQAGIDVLRFQRQNAEAVEASTEGAPERAAAEGRRQDQPFYLDGADNHLPSSDDVLYPPPCAYDITAAEAARMQGTFALQGIVLSSLNVATRRALCTLREAEPVRARSPGVPARRGHVTRGVP